MQPLTFQSELGGQCRIGAIGQVATARMFYRREVHSNLVRATGFQVYVEQAGRHERLKGVVVGDGMTTILDHGKFPVVTAMPADGRIDCAAGWIRMPLHESVIALLNPPVFEGSLELGVGLLGQRYDHHPGGSNVQAVHDPLAFGNTGRRHPEAGRCESTEHGRPGPADGGVGGDACRLVDGNQIVVGIEDLHALDHLDAVLRRRLGLGQRDLQPGTRGQLLGFGDGNPVQQHRALFGEGGRGGARKSQQTSQTCVHTHTGQAVRNRQRARRHDGLVWEACGSAFTLSSGPLLAGFEVERPSRS